MPNRMHATAATLALMTLAAGALAVPDRVDPTTDDHERIQGQWRQIHVEFEGVDQNSNEGPTKNQWTITADFIRISTAGPGVGREDRGGWAYRLDPRARPAALDLNPLGSPDRPHSPAIYKLEGDRLTVCLQNFPARGRPTDFVSRKGSGVGKFVYVRMPSAVP